MFSYELDEATGLGRAAWLQDGLVSRATGGEFPGGDPTYVRLRRDLMEENEIRSKLPDFVIRHRDLSQFWQFIKHKFGSYSERRTYIWDSFRPLLDFLESGGHAPLVGPISETLISFDADTVHAVWRKALERRTNDPEGAITAAKSLLESVCKHVLEEAVVDYPDDADLPKLWRMAAEEVNLAPQQHDEKVFKEILGSCQSVVNSLGAIRNRIGDAHGTGKRQVKPKPRHAELAVNLGGAMASFLVATWNERSQP